MPLDCSIIVPVYNGAATIERLHARLLSVLDKLDLAFEIIYVNDGSRDHSWNVLKRLKGNSDNVRLVNLSGNFGQHNAIFCGLTLCKGNFTITIDDDLQIPPEEIVKLIDCYRKDNADVVYGIYSSKKHAWYRNLGSRFISNVLNSFAESKGRGSSFKLIDRTIVDKIAASRFEYIFLDEIIAWHTDNIDYTPVEHHEREDGESGYSLTRLLGFSMKIILNYTVIPLHLMTIAGIIIAFVCLCLGIYYIYDKIANDVQLGFTSLMVAIFFATGVIMVSLGIIGQYVRRLYYTQLYKPPFKIREIL